MNLKKLGLFAAGTLFGSAGFKLLSSKDAKRVYTNVTAAALRAKESVMTTVTCVRENAGDILADAKAINEERAAAEAAAVVEDNEMNMEIARFLLEQEGAVITEAWNGREALETFRAAAPGAFDVILMDMMMPVMNGLEAARAIRALDRPDAGAVAIFAMTANVFDDDARQSRDAGIDEHLGKPLELPLLVRTILRYCRERPVSGDPR